MGDWDQAMQHYQGALSILRRMADRQTELLTLMNICFLSFAQGGAPAEDLERAQGLAEEFEQVDPLTKIHWIRGDAAFRQPADLPRAFHRYRAGLPER